MNSLFLDDITWCFEENCPHISCRRNRVNMIERTGLHSYAMFKGTEDCPYYKKENKSMKTYIKKPVKITAVQWTGDNIDELKEFVGENLDPRKTEYTVADPSPATSVHYEYKYSPIIHTLEGDMAVSLMDYVIRGVEGEFYPCRCDIFEKTYEEVE